MEASQPGSGGPCQRNRWSGAPIHSRRRSVVSRSGSSRLHRPVGIAGLRGLRSCWRARCRHCSRVRCMPPKMHSGSCAIHWMWWPAIGGLVVGLGGLIFPQALGVGYDTIGALLKGDVARNVILGVLLVKSVIWAVSLGSGTSGGVLAPLLMMGGALGGIEAMFLPNEGAGFWPLVGMGAILGGTMRSPLTGIIFALELTHDINVLLPLLVASVIAHLFTVLVLKRSILTEKVARRGYHLSREYAVDPLEILFARDAMRTNLVAFPSESTMEHVRGDHERQSLRHAASIFIR